MTITELYNQLSSKDFQDPSTGNLFFPAYMYMYDATEEYEIEKEILDIKNRLHRPNSYLDVMVIDIFDEFIAYLKESEIKKGVSRYSFYISQEPTNPSEVDKALYREAKAHDKEKSNKNQSSFLEYLNGKIQKHLQEADHYEVAYVFIKGFGNAFPHIRASKFMNNFEKYIKGYKLIMFYPGEVKSYYSLFGVLKDENLYRAIKLINA